METKEIRSIMFGEDDMQTLDKKFRVACAANNETLGEAFARLMREDLSKEKNVEILTGDFVSQTELVAALDKKHFSVSRQTVLTHRASGVLPSDCFFESKVESNDVKNGQRTYYNLKKCLKFYKERQAVV